LSGQGKGKSPEGLGHVTSGEIWPQGFCNGDLDQKRRKGEGKTSIEKERPSRSPTLETVVAN